MTKPFVFAIVLAGCTPAPGTPPASSGASTETASAPSASATPAAVSSAPASAPVVPAASAASADDSDPLLGKAAPDFTTAAQNGTTVHLAALKGKPVVLYFYPKDETAGCTKEACSFRDAWKPLAKTGAVLVGISADTLDSHRGFADHWKLPFLLVSDPDGAIAHLYGVPFHGVHKRQTIVVGPDGVVRDVHRTVDVTVHADQILADLGHLP